MLADLVANARHKGLLPTVVTFDPHPLHFLAPERAPQMLTSVEQRIEQFRRMGIEVSGVLYFPDIRDLTAEDFATQVLTSALQADWVVVGADFRFGRNRGGDAALLQRMGEADGFQVSIVDMYGPQDGVVSSTRIRALLGEGKVEEAALLLDRHYELTGVVQGGDGRGRTIGFPTANLAVASELLVPANGVYACRVRGDLGRGDLGLRDAVVNIGTRPTFGGEDRRVEAFLFDFEGDLYGRELSIWFVARIREERTFAGVDDLVRQIKADAAAARVLLDG